MTSALRSSLRLLGAVAVVVLASTRPVLAAPGELVLAPPVTIPLGAPASKLRVLDVSGDGIPDLIAGAPVAPGVQVVLGHGDGTFGAPIFTPMANLDEFDLGDVNGDGHSDLVVVLDLGSDAFTMQVHVGDGSGAFVLSGGFDVSTDGGTHDLRLLDVDEDGDLDAVLAQFGRVRICSGDGAGGFAAPGPFFGGGVAMHQELHALDANSDGHLDLMSSGNAFFATGWTVLLGDGAGGFTHAQTGYAAPDGDVDGSAVGDFDGDHRIDFVLTGQDISCGLGCYMLGFAQGTGSGTGFAVPSPDPVKSAFESRIRAGDLDGDGLADIVGGGLTVLLGKGDFTFAAPRLFQGSSTDNALADVNEDGRLDVLSLSQSGSVRLYLNESPPTGWTDLGHGLAGSDGIPSLLGLGEMQVGSPGALKLTHANPDKLAVLFIGATSAPAPFKGGTLVPVPVSILFMLGTSPDGTITLPWISWPSMPTGTDWFFQYAIVDSAGPAGSSLSNAVRALQP